MTYSKYTEFLPFLTRLETNTKKVWQYIQNNTEILFQHYHALTFLSIHLDLEARGNYVNLEHLGNLRELRVFTQSETQTLDLQNFYKNLRVSPNGLDLLEI